VKTILKRNKFYDDENNEKEQMLTLTCLGMTFKKEKARIFISNLAIYSVNDLDFSEVY
jgi:hypothetical protein